MIDRSGRWARRLFRAPARLYRWRLGWLLGHRFLLLEHQGRRSGRHYETVLEVVHWQPEGEVIVVSGWGRVSDWFRNVSAGSEIYVTVGTRRFHARYRLVPPDEAAEVLGRYEHRNRYMRPVINRMLGYMVGRPYDGTPDAQRRLVEELPMVAFRPAA